MSESFLEKSKAFEGVYFADAYQLNTKALDGVIFVKKEELVGLAREADAALAAKDAEIARLKQSCEESRMGNVAAMAIIKRLTAINTAKGELIEWYSNHVVGAFGSKGIQKHNELRARIRSLENE